MHLKKKNKPISIVNIDVRWFAKPHAYDVDEKRAYDNRD
jgi:hypothetical protein